MFVINLLFSSVNASVTPPVNLSVSTSVHPRSKATSSSQSTDSPSDPPTSLAAYKRWTNGQYEVRRTDQVSLGAQLGLQCGEQEAGRWAGRCEVETPGGDVWTVTETTVTGTDGRKVAGVSPVTPPACGVLISRAGPAHLGDWRCRMKAMDKVSVELVITTKKSLVDSDSRLPGTFLPSHYDIMLEPHVESGNDQSQFDGAVRMAVRAVKSSQMFTVHADYLKPLVVPQVWLKRGNKFEEIKVGKLIFDFRRTLIHLVLRNGVPFRAGFEYQISVTYSGKSTQKFGFNRRMCSARKTCWFTQLEPTYARNVFPCMDEPSLKATFSVSVTRRKEYMARSNMPLLKTVPVDDRDDYVMDIFMNSLRMSTYLVAVAVIYDYGSVTAGDNLTVWAPSKEIKAGRGNFSAKIGKEVLRFYTKKFGIANPLPKNDLVYSAGMKNWGLIFYQPDHLVLGEPEEEAQRKFDLMRFVCRELIHSWFGNLVTLSWWSQTWLNEGLSTFYSYVGIDHLDPHIDAWGRFLKREMDSAMRYDFNASKHFALSSNTTDRNSIFDKFDKFLSYQKGASFVRMMESILTTNTFTKGISAYLSSFAFKNAVEDDLFLHLEAAGREDGTWPPSDKTKTQSFSTAMKTWTRQAGLPVVTFTRSRTNKRAWTARQEWLGGDVKGGRGKRWFIPITYAKVGEKSSWNNTKPVTFIDSDQVEIKFGLKTDKVVVFNVQATGYFRVNYDELSWKRIAEILKRDKKLIHPLNRAKILSDVRSLVQTGHVSREISRLIQSYYNKAELSSPTQEDYRIH